MKHLNFLKEGNMGIVMKSIKISTEMDSSIKDVMFDMRIEKQITVRSEDAIVKLIEIGLKNWEKEKKQLKYRRI